MNERLQDSEQIEKERTFKVLRERHKNARNLIGLEQAVLSHASKEEVIAFLEKLPEHEEKQARKGLENFQDLKRRTGIVFEYVQSEAKKVGEETPENLGRIFFEAVTGSKSNGSVKLEIRDEIIVCTMLDQDDMESFALAHSERDAADVLEAFGYYLRYTSMGDRVVDADGPVGFPVLVIGSGNLEKQEGKETIREEEVFIHERQHLLHGEIMGGFSQMHPIGFRKRVWKGVNRDFDSLQAQTTKEKIWDHIKNELFAFLRQGAKASEIFEDLAYGGYRRYIDLLPDEDQEQIRRTLQDLRAVISNKPWMASLEMRRLFVTMLYDVPLQKMVKWAKAFDEYVHTSLHEMEKNFDRVLLSGGRYQYPTATQKKVNPILAKINEAQTAFVQAKIDVYYAFVNMEDEDFSQQQDRLIGKVQSAAKICSELSEELESSDILNSTRSQYPLPMKARHRQERKVTQEEQHVCQSVLDVVVEHAHLVKTVLDSVEGQRVLKDKTLLIPFIEKIRADVGEQMDVELAVQMVLVKPGRLVIPLEIRPKIKIDPDDWIYLTVEVFP
ncbi:MAG TPA: hypothetical protein VJB64_02225 [Patescibacteria group bacterium]|nr:hypothetical protein [Patescibacteria group bacterium]